MLSRPYSVFNSRIVSENAGESVSRRLGSMCIYPLLSCMLHSSRNTLVVCYSLFGITVYVEGSKYRSGYPVNGWVVQLGYNYTNRLTTPTKVRRLMRRWDDTW